MGKPRAPVRADDDEIGFFGCGHERFVRDARLDANPRSFGAARRRFGDELLDGRADLAGQIAIRLLP
jgi:hypothetical protein